MILKNHKYILQFLSIFGFDNWEQAFEKPITSEQLKELDALNKFDMYGLKFKLRDLFNVTRILKLKKSTTFETESDLISLLRTISRFLEMEVKTETKIITLRKNVYYIKPQEST